VLFRSADGLVYTSEKSLEEYASMLESDDVEDIKEDVDAVKEAMDGEPNGMTELKEGIDRLRAAIQRLEGSSHRIAEAMYKDLDDDEEAAND
jgi:molecular chaperone DnaK